METPIPEPEPALTVDTETFIDFGEEGGPAPDDPPAAPTPRPALSGADLPPLVAKPTLPEPPVEQDEGEYLDFDGPDGGR